MFRRALPGHSAGVPTAPFHAAQHAAETDALEAQFASIDAVIAAAEAEAATRPALPDVAEDDLTEQERREVEEAMALVYGSDRPTRSPQHRQRPGHAA